MIHHQSFKFPQSEIVCLHKSVQIAGFLGQHDQTTILPSLVTWNDKHCPIKILFINISIHFFDISATIIVGLVTTGRGALGDTKLQAVSPTYSNLFIQIILSHIARLFRVRLPGVYIMLKYVFWSYRSRLLK